ncbi:MAG: site-specific integrase [Prevotella sp.]|jgi:integrase|nr:site-specific integrase [Prevotella sp.]
MVIKLIVDTRRPDREGKFPLKLSFANAGKTVLTALNIHVHEHEFDKQRQILHTDDKSKKSEFQRHNSYLIKELSRANELLHSLMLQNRDNMSPARFKEMFVKKNNFDTATFNAYFAAFIKNREGKTAEIFRDTLNKIEKKFGSRIYFDDITFTWLENFDREMKKDNNSVNGRSLHFRNIRTVFNDAINKDVIDINLYPFRKFKIKSEKTRKRALSIEHLRMLFNYQGSESLVWARDVAKLIFFLVGINVKDLYTLQCPSNNIVEYKRWKTNVPCSAKLEPETVELMNRFKGKNHLLYFPERMSYKSFGQRINKNLNIIGKEIGVGRLTTYNMRHTWATVAASLEIPKETIGAALGHTGNSITDIYICFDKTKIYEANRRVMNYVLDLEDEKKDVK